MNLKTRQIDFENAFVQAELSEKERIFVTLPVGVHHSTHRNQDVALKLMKSLYGMKESPRLWYKKVTQGMIDIGFERSDHDQCMFMHKENKIIVLLYTDDCLLFCATNEQLQATIKTMKAIFSLTEQDVGNDVFNYLSLIHI